MPNFSGCKKAPIGKSIHQFMRPLLILLSAKHVEQDHQDPISCKAMQAHIRMETQLPSPAMLRRTTWLTFPLNGSTMENWSNLQQSVLQYACSKAAL